MIDLSVCPPSAAASAEASRLLMAKMASASEI